MVGDTLCYRYHIVDKLGYGGYSTVWIARDLSKSEYVALKIGISDSRGQEANIFRALTKQSSLHLTSRW